MTAAGREVVRDLTREGVQLWVEGEALKFRSVRPLTLLQAERLKRQKAAVLDWLASAEGQLEALLDQLADEDERQAMRDRYEELAAAYQFQGRLGDGLGRMDAEWAALDTVERTLLQENEA